MTVPVGIAIGLGMVAAEEDLRCRQIPNWLTAGATVAGLACAASSGWHGLAMAMAGAAVGLAIFLPFHLRGGMGGGDVKLMAAFGALLGPAGILLAALFGAGFGGLGAAVVLLCRQNARAIPYAPAIVLGAWISLLGGSGSGGG